MHVFVYMRACVVTCLSPPHLLRPPTPPPYPPATAPHLTPPCPAPQGLSQKKDEKGNRFPPLWGAVTVDPSAQLRALSSGQWCPAGPLQPPRGRRPLKWAPRLQTPETCLCPAAAGGHWWLTPSLCLWTCHARDAELQLKTLARTTENSHVVSESKPLSEVFVAVRDKTLRLYLLLLFTN